MANPLLRKYRIMIADHDRELGDILSQMLQNMGFAAPYVTRSGREAMCMLAKESYDFLITEWNTEDVPGIDLIKKIRTENVSPQPTLPVIMLTGRAEQSDVIAARDAGVNEYVIKPFSVRAIYSRLERIIERPRNFVVCSEFVGPDRRSRQKPGTISDNRRTKNLTPGPSNLDLLTTSAIEPNQPQLWVPDYSLKSKLGAGVTLQSLITPEVISKAQRAINAINQESLEWIKSDFQHLQSLATQLSSEIIPENLVDNIIQTTLTISSRAGTFGYEQITRVAYMLYLFCRNHLNPQNPSHAIVVTKHVDVLYVLMSQRLSGESDDESLEIINGLRTLSDKFT